MQPFMKAPTHRWHNPSSIPSLDLHSQVPSWQTQPIWTCIRLELMVLPPTMVSTPPMTSAMEPEMK